MASRVEHVLELLPEVREISDPDLAQMVAEIWAEVWEESGWPDLMDVPKSEEVSHRPLVPHVRSVVQQAIAIAEIVEKNHGIRVDRDRLVAAALLHDVSKLVESDSAAESYRKSRLGRLLTHGFYGAFKALGKGLPPEVVNSVLTHSHGASAKPPATLEGIIVHYADMADSDALLVDVGKKTLLEKRWK